VLKLVSNMGYINEKIMEDIITQFIRECNTWNTYVIHVPA
jgi:hypothetical protein